MSTIHDDDDRLLAAARALPTPRPTPTQHQRRRRLLDDAIAAEAVAGRRRLSAVGIAAAVIFAATGAAALVGVVGLVTARDIDEAPPAVRADVARGRPLVPVVTPAPTMIVATPVTTMTATTATTTTTATAKATTATTPPTEKAATDQAAAPKEKAATTGPTDIDAAIAMLVDGDARLAIGTLAGAMRADVVDVDARLARALEQPDLDDDAAGRIRRLRCEGGLRHRRDVAAVEVCRVYSQHHPDDVAARPLAFGAGGLAEELGRLDDAVDLYTRCIVMAPLHGQSSADALKARARVHAAAGHTDDAAADLRLFLRLRPGAGFDDDIQALARALGVR